MSQTPMRRKYSKEFKQDAVNLALKREKPVREIALDLGISPDLLYHWKHEYQKHQQDAFPGSGKLKDAQEEKIRQLERELQLVKEERAILKKAFAVFTKTP